MTATPLHHMTFTGNACMQYNQTFDNTYAIPEKLHQQWEETQKITQDNPFLLKNLESSISFDSRKWDKDVAIENIMVKGGAVLDGKNSRIERDSDGNLVSESDFAMGKIQEKRIYKSNQLQYRMIYTQGDHAYEYSLENEKLRVRYLQQIKDNASVWVADDYHRYRFDKIKGTEFATMEFVAEEGILALKGAENIDGKPVDKNEITQFTRAIALFRENQILSHYMTNFFKEVENSFELLSKPAAAA